jgi:parvulin-like peptidyl-prolyl isomerase
MKRFLFFVLTTFLTASAWAEASKAPETPSSDTLALVGDQPITYSQLSTQLNSSAVVGLSTPALGTPERRTVLLTLLDKAISVNLLYLDAIDQGKQADPQYQRELQTFSDGLLVGLYRKAYLSGDMTVSDQEVDAYFRQHFIAGAELSDDLRLIIEAKIRKEKLSKLKAGLRKHLRTGVTIRLHSDKLDPADDSLRTDNEVIAEYGDQHITWGEAKKQLTTLNNSVELEQRLASLDALIDNRLMAQKARDAGSENDPSYKKRLAEFSKTRLVNLHRGRLIDGMAPTEQEVREYYAENQDRIAVKERRKIQMVVLPDKAQAEAVKARIDSGEITIYQAAIKHSIDPRAKQTLGDFGWVEKGSGFPGLDELAFSLGPHELGGPVQSPAGWHLVLVTDRRAAAYSDIEDAATQNATRRLLLKERLNQYVKGLRKDKFPVAVYEDTLNRLLQEEAQWIAAKTKEMEENPERAQQILDEMRAMVE